MAASGEISVRFADIEDAAAAVRRTAANVDMLLGDLAAMLRPITAAWTGVAADGFQYQQRMWNSAAEDLHAVLMQVAAALDNSHQSYSEADSSLHQLWSQD